MWLRLPVEPAEALLRDYRARFPGAWLLFPDALATLVGLRAGADVRARNDAGLTPLELARRTGASDLVAVLDRAHTG